MNKKVNIIRVYNSNLSFYVVNACVELGKTKNNKCYVKINGKRILGLSGAEIICKGNLEVYE